MKSRNRKKSISLKLDSTLYKFIENQAIKNNRSVNNYIETLLFDAVGYHEPNQVTRQAISEIERISLKRYSNAEELFNELEKE